LPVRPEFLAEPDELTAIRIDATGGIGVLAPIEVLMQVGGDPGLRMKLNFANLSAADLDRALRAAWTGQYESVTVSEFEVEAAAIGNAVGFVSRFRIASCSA
jgi:hypothetical protein